MSPALLLAEILEAAAARAREIDAQERAERRQWIDQKESPLGSKRHCAAVRRLVAANSPGAAVIGRRHLLSTEALAEEMQSLSARTRKSKAKPMSFADELRSELGLTRRRP